MYGPRKSLRAKVSGQFEQRASRLHHSAFGASNGFQVCKCLLNFPGNLFRDLPTLGHTTILNVFTYSRLGREITLGERLALGAAELFHEPLCQPVSGIHTSIEFVDSFIKGISAGCHSDYHPDDPQAAVFDLAGLQAHGHYTCGKCAAGHAHEKRPAHES